MVAPRLRSAHLVLLACGALYIGAAAQARGPRGTALAVAVNVIAAPVVGTVNAAHRTWQSLLIGRRALASTLADHARLREQVEALQRTNQLLVAELATLRQASRLVAELPSRADGAILARVVARDLLIGHTLLLDRGAAHGVLVDSAVLAETGVVGRVDRVFTAACRVQLLSHSAAAAAARIVGIDDEALLLGGESPTLTGLPPFRDIPVHAAVVTTGSEGIYPPGLLLGTTTEGHIRGLFTVVGMELAVHPADVRSVVILPTLPREDS